MLFSWKIPQRKIENNCEKHHQTLEQVTRSHLLAVLVICISGATARFGKLFQMSIFTNEHSIFK